MSCHCLYCGQEMTWESDCNPEDAQLEFEGHVAFYSCGSCDILYEVAIGEDVVPEKLVRVFTNG